MHVYILLEFDNPNNEGPSNPNIKGVYLTESQATANAKKLAKKYGWRPLHHLDCPKWGNDSGVGCWIEQHPVIQWTDESG